MSSTRWPHTVSAAVMLAIAAVAIGACADDDADGGSKRDGSVNVAMVDNPNMQDLARLTPSRFTAKSHIKVNYTVRRAVLRGDRRQGVDRFGARELPEDRVARRAVRSSGPRGSPCGRDRLHQ